MREKIRYEYEFFFLGCLCQSKPGIYARSHEIEMKKQLYEILSRMDFEDERLEKKLMALDNVLEEAYRYAVDHSADQESLEDSVKEWLFSIRHRGSLCI